MDPVNIIEVGPRDGLQNEATEVSVESKVELILRAARAGIRTIEAGAFVKPTAIPQMADSIEVLRLAREQLNGEGFHKVRLAGLVPNLKGAESALGLVDEMAVFTAASESFAQANINASIAESVQRFGPVVEAAHTSGIPVRGYVSTAWGCPFEGEIDPYAVVEVCRLLLDAGIDTLSIGDTIGVAVPAEVTRLCEILLSELDVLPSQIGLHFHDTRGMGAANAWAGYEAGIRTFDASLGGLGGCPFAPGSTGNVATEDLVWMFERSGVSAGGIDVRLARGAAIFAADLVGREPAGHVARAPQWDGDPQVGSYDL